MQTPQIGSGDDDATVTIVVVGGVDPGGGAGLLRDVLTARALGAQPVAVGSAWTEQSDGVHRVEARDPAALRRALRQAVAAGPGAVKVGMVADEAAAEAVRAGLAGYGGPVVVDPVLRSTRGGALFAGEPAALLGLLARATLVTPNAEEAAVLTGRPVVDEAGAAAAGLALRELGAAAVLVKGGHLGGAEAVDTLVAAEGTRRFARARVPGGDVRGTGCALATALAVRLAHGDSLAAAVEAATTWLASALARAVSVGEERHLP